ncbi:MAG: hypothetical protein RL220_1611 [Bacteroidota bacterium]
MKNSTDLEAGLARFVPPAALTMTCDLLRKYPHHLVITPPRATVHGDFRPGRNRHTLTVNGDRNRYAFLITLLHELAHLITHEEHGHRIKPHGAEWKQNFVKLLHPFTGNGIFPDDVEHALRNYMQNPAAATCSDIPLSRVLARYDARRDGEMLISDIATGTRFMYGDSRVFVKGPKRRTRYSCREEGTGHVYLFSAVTVVKVITVSQESAS